jgi:putative membrane protein
MSEGTSCRPPSRRVIMGQGMMNGYDMMYDYGWIYMILGMLLIVGIVLLIVWLIRQSGTESTRSSDRGETALEILKKRYAKGEISKEEYERMKSDII